LFEHKRLCCHDSRAPNNAAALLITWNWQIFNVNSDVEQFYYKLDEICMGSQVLEIW